MNILKNKWLQILLLPLSIIYAAITFLRNKFYDWRVFRSYKVRNCKVISIGNITVGGTGKTPAVEFLANYLTERDKKVAILSRGYRRVSKGTVLVTDGQEILMESDSSGDEPYLLAKNLSNVPIVVEKNRYRGGIFVTEKFNPDYLLLDDAFQHRKITRDVDIVIIDGTKGFGNRLTLPGGILREPLCGLNRASIIWLSRVDQTNQTFSLISFIKKYTVVPIIKSIHYPHSLHPLTSDEQISLELLKKRKVVIFSGIGNPAAFQNTMIKLDVDLKGEFIFNDHHKYKKSDLKKIETQALQRKAEWIITTEKDAVRIPIIPDMKIPIYYLKVKLKIIEGIEHLTKLLNV